MLIQWSEIIHRARVYMDDEKNGNKGFLSPEDWLMLAKLEYRQQYRRWVKSGIVRPEAIDKEFTGPSTRAEGVLAIVGVVRANIQGYANSYFQLDDVIEGAWAIPFKTKATSARQRIRIVTGGALAWSESGNDTTITYVPNYTTRQDVIVLASLNSTLLEIDVDALNDLNETDYTDTIDAGSSLYTSIEGGDIRFTDYTVLRSPDYKQGTKKFRDYRTGTAGEWEAYNGGDNLRIKVYPEDSSSTYVVRYIPVPNPKGSVEGDQYVGQVDIPEGCDERLVLGIVQRGLIKESAASPAVERLILNADAEMNMAAAAKGDGNRLRPPVSTPRGMFVTDLWLWWYV